MSDMAMRHIQSLLLSSRQVTSLSRLRFSRIKWVSNYLGSASILLATIGQVIVHRGRYLLQL